MSVGVENDKGFAFEYSVNDGSSWVEATSFLKGEDWLVNKSWKEVSVEFDGIAETGCTSTLERFPSQIDG
jgi:hypothetical protein